MNDETNPYAAPSSPPPPPDAEAMTYQPTAEERSWALGAHLSILAGGLLTSQIGGLGAFAGPLIIWLIKKETMPFVADQAKEALNFSITVGVISLILLAVTLGTLLLGAIVTLPLLIIISIAALVLIIVAAVKANEGQYYRYPFIWRLVV